VLRPHSVLVLRDGDTLNLIAERYGTTVATLRRINPQLESTQTITAVEGDSLAVLAGRHGTTESKLRSLNPVLQQSETYISVEGDTLSSVAAEQNLSLSLLRQFNPELSSWPSEEPLPAGTTLAAARLPLHHADPGRAASAGAGLHALDAAAGRGVDLPARPALCSRAVDELPEQGY
jgi:LysM repeat protein